jgi:acyl-coenzyme A synthetase/AMP-(fatty) acid ligase
LNARFVLSGSNISPQEVEEALLEHPAVELAGVVGVHDLMGTSEPMSNSSLTWRIRRPES